MKKNFFAIAGTLALALLFAGAVHASYSQNAAGTSESHASGTSKIYNAPAFSSNVCMDYDTSIILTSPFSSSTVTTDLQDIQAHGINCIRDVGFWNSFGGEGAQQWMYRTGIIAHSLGMN